MPTKILAPFPPKFVERVKLVAPGHAELHRLLDENSDAEFVGNYLRGLIKTFTPEEVLNFIGTGRIDELRKLALARKERSDLHKWWCRLRPLSL